MESSHPEATFKTRNMKEKSKIYFLAYNSISEILAFVREPKKPFLENNDIVLLFTSHGTGLAPKTGENELHEK